MVKRKKKKKERKKKKKVKGTLVWIATKPIHHNTDNNRTNANTLHTEQPQRQQREQYKAGRAHLLASQIIQ